MPLSNLIFILVLGMVTLKRLLYGLIFNAYSFGTHYASIIKQKHSTSFVFFPMPFALSFLLERAWL